ncbi:hypothetical protein M0805_004866 [Coniferiporia weirii]|nr:hypothetical protein M0805_004866 [Coniferiporia weirii]
MVSLNAVDNELTNPANLDQLRRRVAQLAEKGHRKRESAEKNDSKSGRHDPAPPPVPPKNDLKALDISRPERQSQDALASALGALNISNRADEGHRFVGGFRPNHPNHDVTPATSLSPTHPRFPMPSHTPTPPGPLPRPPELLFSMPEAQVPQPSRTMMYALSLPSDGSESPEKLQPYPSPPALPPRSISDEPRQSISTNNSPVPRREKLGVAPTRQRSISSPIQSQTISASPSARKNGNARTQCSGVTKKGERCTRQVRADPPLNVVQPDASVERFCFQHRDEVMKAPGFYSRAHEDDKLVVFSEWIPDYLSSDTQALLRVEMEKPRSEHDVPGYIYAFEIQDPEIPTKIHLKVGRSVNLVKRIDEWGKQCGSNNQVLRGWWPGNIEGKSEVSLMKGRVKPGERGPCCHRLERLVHLELADLVVHGQYLHKDFPRGPSPDSPNSKGAKAPDGAASSPSTPVKSPRRAAPASPLRFRQVKPCSDCGAVHKEIFSFTRPLTGPLKGKEWDGIVKPVIERWGRFVNQHI